MADYQRLKKGPTYNMLVVRTELKPKPFEKKGKVGFFYNHLIYFEDENGRTYKGEYIVQGESQHDFRVNQHAEFHVEMEGQYGDEIKPGRSPLDTSAPAIQNVDPSLPNQRHPVSLAIAAMSSATDIYVAQMNCAFHNGDRIEDMFAMARIIHQELISMQQQ